MLSQRFNFELGASAKDGEEVDPEQSGLFGRSGDEFVRFQDVKVNLRP